MKILCTLAVLCLLAACTTGCATGLSPGGAKLTGDQLAATMKDIATDPKCGHTDTLNVILGPVPSGSLFLQRQCPGPPAPQPAK